MKARNNYMEPKKISNVLESVLIIELAFMMVCLTCLPSVIEYDKYIKPVCLQQGYTSYSKGYMMRLCYRDFSSGDYFFPYVDKNHIVYLDYG